MQPPELQESLVLHILHLLDDYHLWHPSHFVQLLSVVDVPQIEALHIVSNIQVAKVGFS